MAIECFGLNFKQHFKGNLVVTQLLRSIESLLIVAEINKDM